MDSLARRFTLALTVPVSIPVLLVILPPLLPTGVGVATITMMIIGWSLIVIGVIGTVSWLLVRSLLRPLVDLTAQLNPTLVSKRAHAREASSKVPLEVRLLRGAVFGRDAIRRREAEERATYVSTLIHDMKTPLLAVERSLDLAQGAFDEEDWKKWLWAASEEVRRLLGLVQDVVDAERLASGVLQVRSEAVDLAGLCKRVGVRVARLRDGVSVEVQINSTQQHVGDPRLLERAVENIAANAVHHARSRVVLEIMPGLVRVIDDGPGLPSDYSGIGLVQPERSSIAESVPSARRSSGLGLFISKRVAEAHGGRLVLESTGEFGTTLLLYVGAPRHAGWTA